MKLHKKVEISSAQAGQVLAFIFTLNDNFKILTGDTIVSLNGELLELPSIESPKKLISARLIPKTAQDYEKAIKTFGCGKASC